MLSYEDSWQVFSKKKFYYNIWKYLQIKIISRTNEIIFICKENIVGKKSRVFPVQGVKACRGRRGKTPLILNLGTRRKSVGNFTLWPICPLERSPIPTVCKLDGPQRQSGLFEQETNMLCQSGFLPQNFQPVAASLDGVIVQKTTTWFFTAVWQVCWKSYRFIEHAFALHSPHSVKPTIISALRLTSFRSVSVEHSGQWSRQG
jgi:hypothetical protein